MSLIDLRLSQLRQFLLVVETKNYQTAARLSYRSQPALSQAIHQLEERLGAPLFEKGARAILTPFGERCFPLIQDAVAHMERSLATMLQIADVSGGRLSLAVLPSVAQHWLPWLLTDFNSLYPDVEIKVLAADSIHVQRYVAQGAVDFGLTSAPTDDPTLAFHPLVSDQYGLLCRTDHRYAGARSLRWDKLAGEKILGNLYQLPVDTSSVYLLENPCIYVAHMPTLVTLVKKNVGILPLPALAFPRAEPSLVFVPLVNPVKKRTVGIMSLKNRSLLPSAQAMVDLLLERLVDYDWSKEGRGKVLARMIQPIKA